MEGAVVGLQQLLRRWAERRQLKAAPVELVVLLLPAAALHNLAQKTQQRTQLPTVAPPELPDQALLKRLAGRNQPTDKTRHLAQDPSHNLHKIQGVAFSHQRELLAEHSFQQTVGFWALRHPHGQLSHDLVVHYVELVAALEHALQRRCEPML